MTSPRAAAGRRSASPSGRPQPGRGLTSFAFEVEGLDSAVAASSLERELNQVEGVSAVVVYSTRTVWISADSSISPDAIAALLKDQGVSGILTTTSVRRRSARNGAGDPRRQMRRHAEAHRRAAIEAERRKRGHTPLLMGSRRPAIFENTEGLHTARDLITRSRLAAALLCGGPVVVLHLLPQLQFDYWQWLCLALSTPVVLYAAWPFHRASLGGARRGMSALDGASSVAVIAAYVFSAVSFLTSHAGEPGWRSSQVWFPRGWADLQALGASFLDVACGVTLLLLVGRAISRRNRLRSRSALSVLAPPPPQRITVVRKNRQGQTQAKEISSTEIRQGDDILIPPGALVPSDGEILSGRARVDMGPVGGVHRMVDVTVGDRIFAGARNNGRELKMRVRATGSRTRLASMHRWVHRAARDENKMTHLANRAASLLVPWTIVLAAANFLMRWLVDASLTAAVATSLALLVAVSPVALALSTPLALRLGLGRAAAHGALLKDTGTIHSLATIESIIFNKVGTLTEGPMLVTGVHPARGENADMVLRVAAALLMESRHAVCTAVLRADREARDVAGSRSGELGQPLQTKDVRVREDGTFVGVVYMSAGDKSSQVTASVWRPRDMGEIKDAHLVDAALSGGSPLVVRWKGRDRGVITVSDRFRDDAAGAIAQLEDLNIETHMITRDTYPVARRVADSLGVSTVLAGIAPDRKEATVRGVHAQGSHVAMVGDTDVSPALRVADVGILMGEADHVDRVEADVVMIREDIESLPELINLGRHVRNTVDWNMWLAWGYNAVAILLALSGVLNPLLATVGMLASSALVERRCARILHPHYSREPMRHTHTWEGWLQQRRQRRDQRRLEEMDGQGQ